MPLATMEPRTVSELVEEKSKALGDRCCCPGCRFCFNCYYWKHKAHFLGPREEEKWLGVAGICTSSSLFSEKHFTVVWHYGSTGQTLYRQEFEHACTTRSTACKATCVKRTYVVRVLRGDDMRVICRVFVLLTKGIFQGKQDPGNAMEHSVGIVGRRICATCKKCCKSDKKSLRKGVTGGRVVGPYVAAASATANKRMVWYSKEIRCTLSCADTDEERNKDIIVADLTNAAKIVAVGGKSRCHMCAQFTKGELAEADDKLRDPEDDDVARSLQFVKDFQNNGMRPLRRRRLGHEATELWGAFAGGAYTNACAHSMNVLNYVRTTGTQDGGVCRDRALPVRPPSYAVVPIIESVHLLRFDHSSAVQHMWEWYYIVRLSVRHQGRMPYALLETGLMSCVCAASKLKGIATKPLLMLLEKAPKPSNPVRGVSRTGKFSKQEWTSQGVRQNEWLRLTAYSHPDIDTSNFISQLVLAPSATIEQAAKVLQTYTQRVRATQRQQGEAHEAHRETVEGLEFHSDAANPATSSRRLGSTATAAKAATAAKVKAATASKAVKDASPATAAKPAAANVANAARDTSRSQEKGNQKQPDETAKQTEQTGKAATASKSAKAANLTTAAKTAAAKATNAARVTKQSHAKGKHKQTEQKAKQTEQTGVDGRGGENEATSTNHVAVIEGCFRQGRGRMGGTGMVPGRPAGGAISSSSASSSSAAVHSRKPRCSCDDCCFDSDVENDVSRDSQRQKGWEESLALVRSLVADDLKDARDAAKLLAADSAYSKSLHDARSNNPVEVKTRKPEAKTWACSCCTLVNPTDVLTCNVCGAPAVSDTDEVLARTLRADEIAEAEKTAALRASDAELAQKLDGANNVSKKRTARRSGRIQHKRSRPK